MDIEALKGRLLEVSITPEQAIEKQRVEAEKEAQAAIEIKAFLDTESKISNWISGLSERVGRSVSPTTIRSNIIRVADAPDNIAGFTGIGARLEQIPNGGTAKRVRLNRIIYVAYSEDANATESYLESKKTFDFVERWMDLYGRNTAIVDLLDNDGSIAAQVDFIQDLNQLTAIVNQQREAST
jgi:hypothetical protein